jgi:SET domain-containing protein
MSYRPLPEYLTIKESPIHGLGLFATKDIHLLAVRDPKDYITHIINMVIDNNGDRIDRLFRSPIGAFINFSKTPNCTLSNLDDIVTDESLLQYAYLRPLRDIKAGEEITLDYRKELCGLDTYKNEEWLK